MEGQDKKNRDGKILGTDDGRQKYPKKLHLKGKSCGTSIKAFVPSVEDARRKSRRKAAKGQGRSNIFSKREAGTTVESGEKNPSDLKRGWGQHVPKPGEKVDRRKKRFWSRTQCTKRRRWARKRKGGKSKPKLVTEKGMATG